MKKIILSLIAIAFSAGVFAQTPINEGTITYTVEWEVPAQMQQMASMFPKELTVYFKGDSSVVNQKSQMSTSNVIMNSKTDFVRLLLDIPMMSKKYVINFTPADLEEMKEKWPEYELKAGTETQTIAGYKATKYTITEKKSNKTSEGWFTKDIATPANSLTQFFDKSNGVPLKFDSFQSGLAIHATVKEIKQGAIPAGAFATPAGYETITFDQLKGMMGGRQ
ncbi:DUF4412 domain-containing protein [Pedobacter sp. HMF7647]|uniref:DUF4412 domain-containing protein n=1 Tax=Hufsiella arboris TaxID=2695275 RepID=A0A7K1YCC2_9SPHI|nr:DUF4412 domain-containing protein [Hufsiella arboris]MXV52215.1 DUF4412 domain-containing protein [Hufsiella arboris]